MKGGGGRAVLGKKQKEKGLSNGHRYAIIVKVVDCFQKKEGIQEKKWESEKGKDEQPLQTISKACILW